MSAVVVYDKPLAVGKIDRYGISKADWLDGEPMTSATITADAGVTISSVSFTSEGSMSALFTGVTEGLVNVHFEYATATRTDCQPMRIRVISC